MVFASEQKTSETGLFEDAYPLLRVEVSRVEKLRIVASASPLLFSKGVEPEMNECSQLQLLPLQLSLARNHMCGFPYNVIHRICRIDSHVVVILFGSPSARGQKDHQTCQQTNDKFLKMRYIIHFHTLHSG